MAVDIDKYTMKVSWGTQFSPAAQFPVIANRIFKTKSEAETYLSDSTASRSAIPGLILRVIEDTVSSNNGAYLVVEDATATSTNNMKMTKLMTGDIDIKFEVVWAKKDPSTGEWIECQEGESGAVQCLKLIHGESSTYVELSKLVVLKDYAKIVDVDASFYNVNTSINNRFSYVDASMIEAFNEIDDAKGKIIDLSTYVDDFVEIVDRKFDNVDSSMIEAFNDIDNIEKQITEILEDIVDINTSINDVKEDVSIHNAKISVIDASVNAIEETLKNGVVTGIDVSTVTKYVKVTPEETSTGNVTISINASVIDSYDASNANAEGLATANYIEERFTWIEIDF